MCRYVCSPVACRKSISDLRYLSSFTQWLYSFPFSHRRPTFMSASSRAVRVLAHVHRRCLASASTTGDGHLEHVPGSSCEFPQVQVTEAVRATPAPTLVREASSTRERLGGREPEHGKISARVPSRRDFLAKRRHRRSQGG